MCARASRQAHREKCTESPSWCGKTDDGLPFRVWESIPPPGSAEILLSSPQPPVQFTAPERGVDEREGDDPGNVDPQLQNSQGSLKSLHPHAIHCHLLLRPHSHSPGQTASLLPLPGRPPTGRDREDTIGLLVHCANHLGVTLGHGWFGFLCRRHFISSGFRKRCCPAGCWSLE